MNVLVFCLGCACLLAASLAALYSRFCRMQADVAGMVAEYRAAGVDPDVAFLGAIAAMQAAEHGRWRSPVRWVAIRYVQLSRRHFMSQ